jgi:RNA polymerase sigma-70 factor (ECF subfamily)
VDENELAAFLRDGYERLVGAVALVAGDAATAEDAVQEALARAWERTQRGDRIEVLDRWVAAVAMNLSRSRLRHLRVERRSRHRVLGAQTVEAPNAEVLDVRDALRDLPPRQREVAVLHYYLDLRTADIAHAMGTSEGTVKSQLAKARAHLASTLGIFDTNEEPDHADAR